MVPQNEAATKAVEKLFRYAKFHAEGLKNFSEGDELKFRLDHFLLTVTAAVQNIMNLVPKSPNESLLNAPRAKTLRTNPKLRPICWAWHARNHVAHNYVTLVWSEEAELTFGDGFASINGSALNAFLVVALQPVEDDEGEFINPPDMQPYELAARVISFWEAAFSYVLKTPTTNRYTYAEITAYWESILHQ